MRTEVVVLLALVGFAVLTMLVYVAGDRRRLVSQDTTGRGGSFFMGFWVRNWFYWFIGPLRAISIGLRLSPLFYNIAAVACGVASGYFFWIGQLPAAGAMILLSGLADVMDGEVARGRDIVSAEGAFLDSTLDRFSEFFVFVGMVAFFQSKLAVIGVVVALGGSLLVSYTRARGESLGVLCKAGVMQRAERMILLALGAILDPTLSAAFGRPTGIVLEVIIYLIAVGTVGTAIYRTVWISRALRQQAK